MLPGSCGVGSSTETQRRKKMENWRKITMVVWVAAGLMAGCHPGMDSLEESVAAPIAQEEEAASDEEGSSFED